MTGTIEVMLMLIISLPLSNANVNKHSADYKAGFEQVGEDGKSNKEVR